MLPLAHWNASAGSTLPAVAVVNAASAAAAAPSCQPRQPRWMVPVYRRAVWVSVLLLRVLPVVLCHV